VLWENPAERAGADMPAFAAQWLKRWPTHLIQAGSASLAAVARGLNIPAANREFYFVGVDQSRVQYMLRTIHRAAFAAGGTARATPQTLTFEGVADKPLQYGTALALSADAVIRDFDVDPCRVAVWWDAQRGWQAIASSQLLRTLELRAFLAKSWKFTQTSYVRMVKYRKYGFDPCLPGLDAEAAVRRIKRRLGAERYERHRKRNDYKRVCCQTTRGRNLSHSRYKTLFAFLS
jgi:hypothetical protein